MKCTMTINGTTSSIDVDPSRRLLDVLREDLKLTGTKEGCGEGECGACTIFVDGRPVISCLMVVGQADGHDITTIEGVADESKLHPVQDALIDFGGTQCGICTPGIVLAAAHLMKHEPNASRERLREGLAGNICRCTGYQLIVDAVASAMVTKKGAKRGR